jgi:N-methylhydantoinase A/oxoprolinase/acetone carboxylase beta subunit
MLEVSARNAGTLPELKGQFSALFHAELPTTVFAGTNTDSVLLDVSRDGSGAVIASHKAPTTLNITLSVQTTLKALLDKSDADRSKIAALAIGTTHFLNAIIERDASRVERVAVIRLASHDFSTGTPPFLDWPPSLKKLICGHSAIIAGGVNIDGKLLAPVDEAAVRQQAGEIKVKGLKNIVVVGIGSPSDEKYHQEEQAETILRDALRGAENGGLNIVCSHNVAGSGLLARENASILNASILNFAKRTIRSLVAAMHSVGLKCPLYLTSNAGHLLPFSEAIRFPIRIFSSGPTNSIRGASFLAGPAIRQQGCIVVDIGGTTTDVGFLLKNGYPRLSRKFTNLAGVNVNLEMPSVESIGLGGGSVLRINQPDGGQPHQVLIGPDSVGRDLLTKALCFGGGIITATDVAAARGAQVGRGATRIDLPGSIVASAEVKVKKMLEACVDRVKLSPEPCTVVLVGGGAIICPRELKGVSKIFIPEHATVANAIGAAMARIYGSAELLIDASSIPSGLAKAAAQALANAVSKGGIANSVIVLNEEVLWVPYAEGQRHIKVEVACVADHGRVYPGAHITQYVIEGDFADELPLEEPKTREVIAEEDVTEAVDIEKYLPEVDTNGEWNVSVIDLKFIEIGCYILGCGGGGSPYATYLHLRQLLEEGQVIRIVRCEDLHDEDVIPPVAGVGTPAVGLERPGGAGVLHAMQAMSGELKVTFTKILATEIGGVNGLGTLVWGSSGYYNIPTVDGDLMGK